MSSHSTGAVRAAHRACPPAEPSEDGLAGPHAPDPTVAALLRMSLGGDRDEEEDEDDLEDDEDDLDEEEDEDDLEDDEDDLDEEEDEDDLEDDEEDKEER